MTNILESTKKLFGGTGRTRFVAIASGFTCRDRNAGDGATIKPAGSPFQATGRTAVGDFNPPAASNPHPFSKWLCLEGTFRLDLRNGQSVEVGPGKTVTTDGTSFSKVQNFDIGQVMKTSLLVIGYDTPLPSHALDLIALEEQKQL